MPTARLQQLVLSNDELEVVFLPEVGARLHRLRAFGHDLLRTPDDPATHRDDPFFWGAYPMAPWCNRARSGSHSLAGRVATLRPNFPDGSAIHGLVHAIPWTLRDDASLAVEAGGDDIWPWAFEVVLRVSLEGTVLTLDYRLTNHSDAPMPAGLGLHPWFRQPLELCVPAAQVYDSNTDSPARPTAVQGAFDLRRSATPAENLDATWTGLTAQTIDLAWPELGISGRLELETPRALVAIATPPDKRAAAVEPQSHGPDPLRRLANGELDAPILLPPGDELPLILRLRVARVARR